MKPIWTCLTNDALQQLPGSDALRSFHNEVQRSPEQRQVIFCYSFTSFTELMVETDADNLAEHQLMLRIADNLCGPGRGAYLPPPALYLNLWLKPPEEMADRVREVQLLDEAIQCFIGAKDYAEFEARLGHMQVNMAESLLQHYEMVHAAIRQRRELIPRYDHARSRFAQEVSAESLLAGNRRDILSMYDLVEFFDGRTNEDVLTTAPGVRYYLELERAYLDRYYFEGVEPQPDDYFRKQQAVYLDGCDYVVSGDPQYQRLLGRYEVNDLAGRAVAVDDVVKHLRRPILPKRTRVS